MFAKGFTKIKKKKSKVEIFCLFVCLSSLLLSLEFSSSSFGCQEFFLILFNKLKQTPLTPELEIAENILFHVRLPRIIVASLCGGALGVAGVISQGLFRNSLASPSLTGSASGATLGAVLCFYYGQAWSHTLSVPLFAISGAFVTSSLLLFLYRKSSTLSLTKLLLVGLTFSTLTNALCSFVISLEDANPYKSFAIYRWLLGGFHSVEWSHLKLSFIPLILSVVWAIKIASRLDILCLGDDIAQSLGVELKKIKTSCLVLLSLILGIVVSIAGSVPFIGLIAPHITRNLVGSHHKKLMIYTFCNSISLVLCADMIAKKTFSHKELELGIILSLIGSPFFLYLILRNNNLENMRP